MSSNLRVVMGIVAGIAALAAFYLVLRDPASVPQARPAAEGVRAPAPPSAPAPAPTPAPALVLAPSAPAPAPAPPAIAPRAPQTSNSAPTARAAAPAGAAPDLHRLPPLPTEPPRPPTPAEPRTPREPDASAADTPFPASRDGIQQAIRQATPQLKHCYESWLMANNQLRGKLLVRFTIGGSGQVDDAKLVDTGMDHPFMEGCVLNVFSSLKFQPPERADTVVNYPLRFSTAR